MTSRTCASSQCATNMAAAYMADGYARGGGGIGTALVVPGPGLQNASAGIGTAYAASSPILVVAGQIPSRLIGVRRGMLHEIDDQLDTIRPVTKWAHRILDPAETPSAVHEAFRQLKTGRPRPVEIEMPPDTLAKQADIELLEPGYPRAATSPGIGCAGGRTPARRRLKACDLGRRRRDLVGRLRPAAGRGGAHAGPDTHHFGGQGRRLGQAPTLDRRTSIHGRAVDRKRGPSSISFLWSAVASLR